MDVSGKKSGAFQVWASAALLLLFLAPAIFFISDETGDRVAALRKDGLVTMATVTGKRTIEEPYTDSKGRRKSNTAKYIDLSYDSQTNQSYPEWLAGGEKAQVPKPGVAMNSYAYRSTNAEYDSVNQGDKVPVVINRYERTRADLATFVKEYSNTTLMFCAAMAGLIGLFCAMMAWRTRQRA